MQLQIKHLVRLNPRVAVQRRRLPGRKLWSCCETATRPHAGAGAWSCRFYASDCAYSRAFSAAREQPDVFWGEKGLDIDWFEPWTKTLHVEDPVFPNWFVGGRLNMCYNAVDRHVESGRGEQPAIIHDSPVTGTKKIITYGELQVSKLAGVLVKNGVRQGDLVVIYMPMVPEAMIAMLACARIGAPHSLIFGGFASKELSVRIDHAKPKLMVTASFGVEPGRRVEYIPLVKKALEMSCHRPSKVLIYNRPNMEKVFLSPELSLDWDEEMASARPHECVSLPSNHPLYVLYTSGTTGTPKGVVRDTAGYAVMLKWTMSNIYGLKPGDIWWAASDLGWVVGHSYICYAPLLHGNSTILYEGKPVGTPDPGAFFRVLSEHGASSMFTAPTAIRAIRQQDPHAANGKKYALNRLQSLFVAGERCDVETLEWAKKNFGVPVLDHWWQTETGSAITASFMGLGGSLTPPAGQAGKPVPGYNVIDDQMQEVKPRTLGNIVVRLPLPPGAALSLWENKSLFKKLYFSKFPGYYDTMDAGFLDEDGFLYIMSRSDDVINVAGHRLSAGALEEVRNPAFAVCVRDTEEKVRTEIVKLVRDTVGPVAAFKNVLFVQGLPKTRSGKIPRSSLSNLINGKPYKVTPTIEDPEVFKDIERQVGKFQRS
uniref:Acyl-CoA synthetase short-chain family member 3, mitochondrial n=1 Tax=Oryzias latipes TaxID=8090 RepID=H2MNN4_ORYLA